MSPIRSSTYLEDHSVVAGPSLSLRVPEGIQTQTQSADLKSSTDLPLRTFPPLPRYKKPDERLNPEMLPERHEGKKHHNRSASADVELPRSSDRRCTTGDKLAMSRSIGGSPVVRRVQSSYGPRPATVEHADDMETTRTVDSECEGDLPGSETDVISSTTFIARIPITTEIGKVLSGSPGEEVDPAFISELTQHEEQHISRPSSSNPLDLDTPVQTRSENTVPVVIRRRKGQSIAGTMDRLSLRSQSSHSSNDSRSQRSPAETVETSPEPSIYDDFEHTGLGLSTGSTSSTRSTARKSTVSENEGPLSTRKARHSSSKSLETYTPEWRYGTPEMSRGHAKLPVLSPNELQPRPVVPGLGYPKHLPRAEKLPVSGYELLASRLSAPAARPRPLSAGLSSKYAPQPSIRDRDQPQIKPIYRRFEALNHRLLLHLQDELSELEEHLHRLDTTDTQTRRLQNTILPASRRAESVAAGELQWHKTDILAKIGAKLEQYNQALASFSQTKQLPPAKAPDIEVYRSFLTTHNPIAETETRFLDAAEDLVSLSKSPLTESYNRHPSNDTKHSTLLPGQTRDDSSQSASARSGFSRDSSQSDKEAGQFPAKEDPRDKETSRHKTDGSTWNQGGNSGKPQLQSHSQLLTFPSRANEYPAAQAAFMASLAGILPIILFRMVPAAELTTARMLIVLVVGVLIALIALLGRCLGMHVAGFSIGLHVDDRSQHEEYGQQRGRPGRGRGRNAGFSGYRKGDLVGVLVSYAGFVGVVALLF